ncbi:MAG: mxaG (cytochrome c1) involved in methanol dehydrogenase (mxaG3) [candidate division NC10 bacterium CSP1-5]|nr:MAG: mxaG (cytochrome c1) involved in methanol dehydrogenase (mxaG3) [candidate division NC10 bacterium CSP1-5]
MRQRRWILVALVAGLILGQPGNVPAQDQAVKKLNPFTGNPEAITEGKRLFSLYGCPGCHGKEGGGGMGRPLLDDEWQFGSDDGTLFKLIRGEIPGQTMPDVFGKAMKDEEIWQVIAFIRTLYKGDPSRINW